jgi:glyoxylase-like metal-dependent hydrolase (beta-lactamase superfamily II)
VAIAAGSDNQSDVFNTLAHYLLAIFIAVVNNACRAALRALAVGAAPAKRLHGEYDVPDHFERIARLSAPPRAGELVDIADGLLWAQLPLPFALDHVNIYFLEDDGGFAAVDTGIGDEKTKQAWRVLLDGPLRGKDITRLILTHHHPDHMGLAGWLVEQLGVPIHMTETEFLFAQHLGHNAQAVDVEGYRDFYRRHGMEERYADVIVNQGHQYKRMITGLPWNYRQLNDGEVLSIGGRMVEILTGGGHSSNQAMLFSRDEGIFLSADQVLPKITPNIGVLAISPEADPLGLYLRSLSRIREQIPNDVLVLPGHKQPFTELYRRIDELENHHEVRCRVVEKACREQPLSAAEVRPLLFNRDLDPHTLSFAFSETLAHMNMMAREGRIAWESDGEILRATAA